jgi:hypothetical protein
MLLYKFSIIVKIKKNKKVSKSCQKTVKKLSKIVKKWSKNFQKVDKVVKKCQ